MTDPAGHSPASPRDDLSSFPLGLSLRVRDSGLAWIEFHPRRGPSTPLSLATLRQLARLLEEIEQLAAEGSVRLLLLSTAPPHSGLTGYDLDELGQMPAGEIARWSAEAQEILRSLEDLAVPSVAGIQCEWLGGAAELALACSYRVAAGSADVRIGFPQTRLGLLPAWGGTVRLPRLVGLNAALRLVLTGRSLIAEEAFGIGLVDRVAPAGEFGRFLEEYGTRRLEHGRPRRRRRRPVRRRVLDETAPGRRLLVARASRLHLDRPYTDAAARLALDLIAETLVIPLDQGFAGESAAAARLLVRVDTRARLHAARLIERATRRLPIGEAEIEGAAVLGGGRTASDLAHRLVSGGIPVRIRDARREVVRRGLARAQERIDWELKQDRLEEGEARRSAARLTGGPGFGGFGTLDLVVAAIEEPAQGAAELLREVEPHVRESCVLGFHDWAASPSAVQHLLRNPHRVVGLVPSLPMDRFPLLEIVPGALTSSETVSLARRLARRVDLVPVVVADQAPSPGSRLLGAYLAEGARLLDEGATVDQIDGAAVDFGFEAGPFHRADAIGAPLALRLLEALAARLGPRMAPGRHFTRVGREASTFYRYRRGRPSHPHPSLPAGVAPQSASVVALIQRRLLLLLINEAGMILEEGGVTDPRDLELVALYGLGFPRGRGGLLFHADGLGLAPIVADLEVQASRFGERFAPTGLLRDLAAIGRGFFAPPAAGASGQGPEPTLE